MEPYNVPWNSQIVHILQKGRGTECRHHSVSLYWIILCAHFMLAYECILYAAYWVWLHFINRELNCTCTRATCTVRKMQCRAGQYQNRVGMWHATYNHFGGHAQLWDRKMLCKCQLGKAMMLYMMRICACRVSVTTATYIGFILGKGKRPCNITAQYINFTAQTNFSGFSLIVVHSCHTYLLPRSSWVVI